MSVNIPDITVDLHSEEEMSEEFEDFYHQCDRLYNRVANYPVILEPQCKKDSRFWLYKNRERQRNRLRLDGELMYEQIFSVVGVNGRRYKKDSRVWFHKTSEKAAKLKQLEQMAKQKELQKNSNCRMTPSFSDEAGIDENSLTAMSKIAICNDPGCLDAKECYKRCHEIEVQDNCFVGAGNRNRKRRKIGHSVPASPAYYNDSNFAIVSRSLDSDIGYSDCLNKMNGDMSAAESDSSDSLDHHEHHRSWKHEKSPIRCREFKVVETASSSSNGCSVKRTPVSSGGSINLTTGLKQPTEPAPNINSRDNCLHVQYTPKRKISVYTIENEDFYDFLSPPSWVIDDSVELDMEETFKLDRV